MLYIDESENRACAELQRFMPAFVEPRSRKLNLNRRYGCADGNVQDDNILRALLAFVSDI